MLGQKRKKDIKWLSQELKSGAKLAGQFDRSVDGVPIANYRIEKYTLTNILPGLRRGLLFKTLQDGTDLEVVSAHESGEAINAGNYEHQRDLAIRYARQEGAGYLEVDLDKIEEVLTERRRI